mmetsp:Transcript_125930/g.403172  ORF Transcript_125930/g.403172 Transcript_125930/m.403172 type:complete len:105 (+) Transcript_125930:54-368(+)
MACQALISRSRPLVNSLDDIFDDEDKDEEQGRHHVEDKGEGSLRQPGSFRSGTPAIRKPWIVVQLPQFTGDESCRNVCAEITTKLGFDLIGDYRAGRAGETEGN